MKKAVLSLSFFGLATACFLAVSVAEEENLLAGVTPEGYDYTRPEAESPLSCLNCKYQRNYHQYRVLGVQEPNVGDGTIKVTGKGWLSSAHATSFEAPTNNNTYCAWCHAPTTETVTYDASRAKKLKKGKWHGMSCNGCHTTHGIAGEIGTRLTNYKPGHDLEEEESYIPRHSEDGLQANKQCLFCHGTYHGFSSRVKEALLDSGSLRCIDCHMAGYRLTDTGTVERYHNMKVAENLPKSCNGRFGALISCHSTATKKWVYYVIPKIFDAHVKRQHKLPGI